MKEVERKFVAGETPSGLTLSGLPSSGEAIRQGYLAVDGPVEVRIRDRAGRCTLTVKSGSGLERHEVEIGIGDSTFDELWSLTSATLEKTRYPTEIDAGSVGRAVVAEVDVYGGSLAGLVVVEVEFEHREAAEQFEPPAWFGIEVTGDKAWSNASLARRGRPDAG